MPPSPPPPTEKRSDVKTQLPTLVRKTTALAVLERVDLLAESNALAFDIGGSLAKILYLQPYGRKRRNPRLIIDYVDPSASSFRSALSIDVPELRGTLHFFAIETRNIEACVQFIQANWKSTDADRPRVVRATGGGAYKYRELFRGIGVELNVRDEMACTVAGLNFLLTHVEHEVFSCPIEPHSQVGSPNPSIQRRYRDARPDPFPYLLCHIGSGVSFIKVTGFGEYERVSGSSLVRRGDRVDAARRQLAGGHAGGRHLRRGVRTARTGRQRDRVLVRQSDDAQGATADMGQLSSRAAAFRDRLSVAVVEFAGGAAAAEPLHALDGFGAASTRHPQQCVFQPTLSRRGRGAERVAHDRLQYRTTGVPERGAASGATHLLWRQLCARAPVHGGGDIVCGGVLEQAQHAGAVPDA
eukprot:ctg_1133.g250